MSLSLLLPAGGLLFGGYFLQHLHKQSAEGAQRRLRGLLRIVRLRRLVEVLPQHRGMANALLRGEQGFRDKLAALGRQVDGDMAQLAAMADGGDPWAVAERCAHIGRQWAALKGNLHGLQPPESFAKHTVLMREILYLINDVARAAGLLSNPDVTRAKLADAAVNQLPLVTEVLGQARGMGAGVAASGKCTTDMRVKLSYLLQKARSVAAAVAEAMSPVLTAESRLMATTALAESQASQERFLALLEGRIINSREVEIPAGDFFAAGTQAIEHSFALLDDILTAMQARLQAEADAHGRRLWWVRGAVVVSCSPLALWLGYGF
jgi:methyl-accepting chemotaxis protein